MLLDGAIATIAVAPVGTLRSVHVAPEMVCGCEGDADKPTADRMSRVEFLSDSKASELVRGLLYICKGITHNQSFIHLGHNQ